MITLITGGARSGKSSMAQQLALSADLNPTYLATARKWEDDEAFMARIERHRLERGDNWETLEIDIDIANATPKSSVMVIDCITLWLTNLFMDTNHDLDATLKQADEQLDKLFKKYPRLATRNQLILVSNEIGMGLHAQTDMGRQFTDLQGWINQRIAKEANRVIFMVAGLPLSIKDSQTLDSWDLAPEEL